MKPVCIICNSASSFLMKKDGYDLYRCPSCSLVFVHPQPASDFLKDKVYSFESGYQSNKKGDFGETIPDKKTEKIMDFLKGNVVKGKLLDVGCSSGEFMYHAGKLGFDTYGVELNKRTADVARSYGLNVFNGFLKDANFAQDSFDVIFLGDIIEHVNSPREFIQDCHRLLKRGGLIIISTPNLDCIWSRMTFQLYRWFNIPWSSVTPPYHLFQFSFNNINRLMRDEAFSLISQFYLHPPRLMYELGSMHLLKKYKENKSILRLLYMTFAFGAYTKLYILDRLLTPLKKRDFSMVTFYTKF